MAARLVGRACLLPPRTASVRGPIPMKSILHVLCFTLFALSIWHSTAKADLPCICKGTGQCAVCDGTGQIVTASCFACNGTGRCTICQGASTRHNEPAAPSRPAASDRVPCDYCHGTGKNPTDNLSGTVPTFGNDLGEMYCSICGQTVHKPHIHGPCPVCNGRRYLQR